MSDITQPAVEPPIDDFDALLAEADAAGKESAARAAQALRRKLAERAVLIGQGEEPPPRSFLVEDLMPSQFITILFGHGGSGKSFLAEYLALCIILGRPFFGREVRQGNVLWVDAEDLGQEEIERRTWHVARGMGLDRPPGGLFYYSALQSLNKPAVAQEVRAIVETHSIELVVLDSLSVGALGLDVSSSQDAVGLMRGLMRWGTTVLALDHVSKRAASGETSASAFGSAFKHNMVRSSIGLSPAKGDKDVVRMDHHKANFGRKLDPLHYVMDFEEGGDNLKASVRFRSVDAPASDAEGKPDTVTVTLELLRSLYAVSREPVPARSLADQRGLAPQTTSNHLSKLAGRQLAESRDGGWVPLESQPPLSLLTDSSGGQGGKEETEPPLAAAA